MRTAIGTPSRLTANAAAGVIPTPRLRHSSVRFSARHASGRAGRRMSPEVFSIGVTIDVSPSLVMRGRFVTRRYGPTGGAKFELGCVAARRTGDGDSAAR